MDIRAAFAEPLWGELCLALNDREECAGVIFAGRVEEARRLTLCANRIVWVPAEAYELRSPTEMKIRSEGWMPALAEAAEGEWQPIFFHTHPTGEPVPSAHDEQVAAALAAVFKARTGKSFASMILAGPSSAPRFTSTLHGEPLSRLRVVGDRLRVLEATDLSTGNGAARLEPFDRQIRAFGSDGQRLLGRLRIGVVGAGGTGSAVFEQLVRLGVGEVVLLDDDDVTATNLTRIHGSTGDDVGTPKVEVLARSAGEIGLGCSVETHQAKLTDRSAFEALRGCDVVFGCTDDNAGRAILSRLAYYYCTTVIDMGVLIAAQGDEVSGLYGRVSVMAPGTPCLHCRGRIDPNRLREEQLPEAERAELSEEGYAQGLGDPDPAVLTYTTMIAAYAVDEMLQRLFGFGEESPAAEILVRPIERKVGRLEFEAKPGHLCVDPGLLGRGDREPPLGLGWR